MKDQICIVPRHIPGTSGYFNVWSHGQIVFWGMRPECDAFRDAYDSAFDGVTVNASSHTERACELGLALAVKHGAPTEAES